MKVDITRHESTVNDGLVTSCAKLYSDHFGKWTNSKNIKLSSQKLHSYVRPRGTKLAVAYDKNTLIGYIIVSSSKHGSNQHISWVTQLVVHSKYRNQGIAKKLITSLYYKTNNQVWAIITNNPYAVRALESIIGNCCSHMSIEKTNKDVLFDSCLFSVPYVSSKKHIIVNDNECCIFTSFFTDRTKTKEMLINVSSSMKPWRIGHLRPGYEWFAVTATNQ